MHGPAIQKNLEALQKTVVRRKLLKTLDQHLQGVERIGPGQGPAEGVDLLQDHRRKELFLLAGSALRDVHGREDAALEQAAVENDLGVPGPLELLEDHFVHSRTGIDQ